jgi:hypothetical protein
MIAEQIVPRNPNNGKSFCISSIYLGKPLTHEGTV